MKHDALNIEIEWRVRADAFGEVLDLIADSDNIWEWLTYAVTQKWNQAVAFHQSYKQGRDGRNNTALSGGPTREQS